MPEDGDEIDIVYLAQQVVDYAQKKDPGMWGRHSLEDAVLKAQSVSSDLKTMFNNLVAELSKIPTVIQRLDSAIEQMSKCEMCDSWTGRWR